jgi:hypothetical protein
MSSLPAAIPLSGVDRRARLSKEEFDREYLFPRRPVVVTDALSPWKALGRWTPEFFQERFAERQVNIDGSPRALGPFIDEVLASTAENPAPYLRNEELHVVFPELVEEVEPLPSYLSPNWLRRDFNPEEARILTRCGGGEIYIGGAGRSFPVVHYDFLHTHAFLMQLHGTKHYFLYGPDQTPLMYQVPGDPNRSDLNDVENPNLEKYPLFAQARGHSFLLEPGEMLFVPSGWWHTVRMLSPSITVSVNVANRSNWADLRRDFCRVYGDNPRRKRQLGLYLRLVEARCRVAELFARS